MGRKFFSLPKRVKPQNYLDPLVRRRKGHNNNMILKQMWVRSINKQKITNSVLERTKNCLKKKEQNQKPSVFLWTLFLFDNDSNNLYFYLPFSFNDTQTRTNWHKLVYSSAFSVFRGIGALVFTTSTSFRSMLSFSYSFLITQFSSSFSIKTYGTLLHRNTCVLGENERTSNQWLHLLTNGLVGLFTWTQFFARALPLI